MTDAPEIIESEIAALLEQANLNEQAIAAKIAALKAEEAALPEPIVEPTPVTQVSSPLAALPVVIRPVAQTVPASWALRPLAR